MDKQIKHLKLVLLAILLAAGLSSKAQTQAEMDKMIKDANPEIEKMKKDPVNNEFFQGVPDLDSMTKAGL